MSDKKTFFNGKWYYFEQELINAMQETDINEARRQESEKRYQNILLCLYELKKEILQLRYEIINCYPERENLEKACIIESCDFIMNKFPEFQMPKDIWL